MASAGRGGPDQVSALPPAASRGLRRLLRLWAPSALPPPPPPLLGYAGGGTDGASGRRLSAGLAPPRPLTVTARQRRGVRGGVAGGTR